MARKIDWSGLKEYLFNHGEKIALGSCAFLALVLGLWGIWSATSAGRADGTNKTFAEIMHENVKRIRGGIDGAPMPDPNQVVKKLDDWAEIKSTHVGMPLINIGEDNLSNKRNRPPVLPIKNDQKIVPEYIAGLVLTYESGINNQNKPYVSGLEAVGQADPGQPVVQPKGPKPGPMQPGTAPTIPPFLQVGRPERMVVVQAVVPLKQQVEEFRKALVMPTQEDMFVKNRDDLPRYVGFDVYRFEVMPDGKPSAKPMFLIGVDPEDGQFKVNAKLEKLLREAIYDEKSAELLEKWIYAGLATPMPKLANRKYPKFTFKDFEVDWTYLDDDKNAEMVAGGPNMPKKEGGGPVVNPLLPGFKGNPKLGRGGEGPGPGGVGPKPAGADFKVKEIMVNEPHLLRDSYPQLVSRLFTGKEKRVDKDMNVYHVLGNHPTPVNKAVTPVGPVGPNQPNAEKYFAAWDVEAPGAAGPGGVGPVIPVGPRPPGGEGGRGPVVGPGGQGAASTVFPAWNRDALLRFVDPSVEPGKKYFYTVRVRLANPNYGKPKEVAYEALASSPELPPSDWVKTEEITIPQEYNLFAVDQHLFDDWAEGKVEKKSIVYPPNVVNNYTFFQIHQWIPKKRDLFVAADYVIGDWVIAESQMVRKGDYIGKGLTVLAPVWVKEKDAFEVPQHKDPSNKNKNAPKGIHLNMEKDNKAPILVDFTGGKRLAKSTNALEEETAVDALILMPDGKLTVLNSRVASEIAERQERVITNRRRIEEVQSNGNLPAQKGPGGGGPNLPGFGPKGGGG